ncbi:AI-2E family transporter [Tanticharoenia sakaeratensis]|uniref:Transporter n=1 Tax=Tanticharoenia sakaeratensis NBRC 103193 TaxID=1231623 RepID=A0A0D6MGY9_9PROT|nr:AI-2E family transporter [Tanticharoenia sakaeratensis]GAN52887.1 transporter [Tanticharoenia sakaeratensis NBRC 103193]GBQ18274.1 permease [Tanticharoenia sakaeratensis NBRC 103193]
MTDLTPAPDHESRPHHFGPGFQLRAQLVMALAFIALTIFTLGRFREAVVWGAILATVCWPIQSWIKARLPRRHADTVAPLGIVFAILLIFLIPIGAIGVEVANEAEAAHAWVDNAQANGTPEPAWVGKLPYGSAQVSHWWQQNLADPQGEHNMLHKVGADRTLGMARRIGHEMANGTVLFVFSLLILFFLLRSGRHLTDHCLIASHRLFGARGESVMRQIVGSVRGSMAGLVLVGLGEGVLITISYVIAGAPQPLLLGILTAIASMIPMLGSVAVAIAVLLLLAKGTVGAAIAVGVFGMVVLFLADHFVRPVLIGGSTKLPFVWVLLGILGGLETWGLIGLFVGPALMAVTHLLWRIMSRPGMLGARG